MRIKNKFLFLFTLLFNIFPFYTAEPIQCSMSSNVSNKRLNIKRAKYDDKKEKIQFHKHGIQQEEYLVSCLTEDSILISLYSKSTSNNSNKYSYIEFFGCIINYYIVYFESEQEYIWKLLPSLYQNIIKNINSIAKSYHFDEEVPFDLNKLDHNKRVIIIINHLVNIKKAIYEVKIDKFTIIKVIKTYKENAKLFNLDKVSDKNFICIEQVMELCSHLLNFNESKNIDEYDNDDIVFQISSTILFMKSPNIKNSVNKENNTESTHDPPQHDEKIKNTCLLGSNRFETINKNLLNLIKEITNYELEVTIFLNTDENIFIIRYFKYNVYYNFLQILLGFKQIIDTDIAENEKRKCVINMQIHFRLYYIYLNMYLKGIQLFEIPDILEKIIKKINYFQSKFHIPFERMHLIDRSSHTKTLTNDLYNYKCNIATIIINGLDICFFNVRNISREYIKSIQTYNITLQNN